jgi:hypothetical protein
MCFIWRYVLQNCLKMLNLHKVSKLSEFRYLAEIHFRIFCTFCIYCFIIFIWRWGIWTLNFLLQWGICRHFCTGGGEFDQSNFKKFKFPGSARGGGMLKFRIDRYITLLVVFDYSPNIMPMATYFSLSSSLRPLSK